MTGRESGWIPFGDAALLHARPTGSHARALGSALRRCAGVFDVVVTEDRVCVHFDPRTPPLGLEDALSTAGLAQDTSEARELVVSARYDGPDLAALSAGTGLSVEEVVGIHTAASYEVVMLGFLPGFAYLRGLDPRLVMPRRPVPRPRVAAGSIAVGGEYTAIYPFVSPGGWNLIGRAIDCALFDGERGARLQAGDRVRFVRVD